MKRCPVCGERECLCEDSVNWLYYKWKSIYHSESTNSIINFFIILSIVIICFGGIILLFFRRSI